MTNNYERKVFYSKEDNGWIAVAPELPGCSACGKNPETALKELEKAVKLWIKTAKDKKWPVPKPASSREPGGKVLLRLPKELHHEYITLASEEGISLNQFMLYVLARYRDLGHLARHHAK